MPTKGSGRRSSSKSKKKVQVPKNIKASSPRSKSKPKASAKSSKVKTPVKARVVRGKPKPAPAPKGGKAKKAVGPKTSAGKKSPVKTMKKKTGAPKSTRSGTSPSKKRSTRFPEALPTPPPLSSFSPAERYDIGGLCACLIDTMTSDGTTKLKRLFIHLGLSELDRTNLLRVTQGYTIPTLFAHEIKGEAKRWQVFHDLLRLAFSDGHYERRWQKDLRGIAQTLGLAFEEVEQAEKQFLKSA